MRKGEYCIRNIDKLVEEGCISPKRANELKNWQEFRDEHSDMSELSERACQPLMRETDPKIKAEALEAVGRNIAHGNVPTTEQVKSILDNKRGDIKPKGRISNDLSGIYRPSPQTPILEVPPDEDIVEEEENVVIEEEVLIDEENEVLDEDEVVDEEDTSVMPNGEVGDIEGIPQMPVMVPQGDMPIVEEDKNEDKDEEIEEESKKSQADIEAAERERLARLKEREVQRADNEAEKIVATCLKSILRRGYPGHKLNWLVLRAVSDVIIPDRGCPMPGSGSVTQGGAITTNLGGR